MVPQNRKTPPNKKGGLHFKTIPKKAPTPKNTGIASTNLRKTTDHRAPKCRQSTYQNPKRKKGKQQKQKKTSRPGAPGTWPQCPVLAPGSLASPNKPQKRNTIRPRRLAQKSQPATRVSETQAKIPGSLARTWFPAWRIRRIQRSFNMASMSCERWFPKCKQNNQILPAD